jgi:flagellar hook-associated protein 2
MSDLSIPGVGTSKYGTDKLIEGLMKVERVPRDRAADQVKKLESQKTVWLGLNQRLTTLRNDIRNLYSFQNPFNARVAKSSDEETLTATATREAIEQTKSVLVKRAATADRFISSDLPKDYRVEAGKYVFSVGEKSVELNYGGGNLKDFADSITKKGRDLLRASVISISADNKTQSLVLESLQTGAKNKLGFQADAEKLALASGLVEKATTTTKAFDPAKPKAWEAGLDARLVQAGEGKLSILAGGSARLGLDASLKTKGLVLELQYRLIPLGEEATPSPPPGPSLKPVGEASYGGVTIHGEASETGLPAWTPPYAPPRVEDKGMAFLIGPDGSSRALPELSDSTETTTMTVELGSYLPELSGLGLRSRDTTRRLELVSARVYDPAQTGGYKPKRPISTAQDSLVSVDGIEVTRPTNAISDVIPAVTLNLKAASEKPVNLKIEPDRKAVKDALIAAVGSYNRSMAEINILTRDDEKIISEIGYFTDDEKKKAKENLGILLNDSTLSMMRTSLQNAMMAPYDTGLDYRLLAQLGISTDAQKAGGGQGYDATKMRGYLEIDEDTLDKALASNFEAAKRLFGYDSDGDLIPDTGAAVRLDAVIKPYVETAGLISIKTSTLDNQIKRGKSELATLDEKLTDKEAELKRKYAAMEGSLNQMDSTSNSISNWSNNNNQ